MNVTAISCFANIPMKISICVVNISILLITMSIVLPFAPSFSLDDLSREIVSSVIHTVSENIRLVRKISQFLSPPFNSSTLICIVYRWECKLDNRCICPGYICNCMTIGYNTVSENIRLVRKISQFLSPPFNSSTLISTKGKT
jgi:hypothetical protein